MSRTHKAPSYYKVNVSANGRLVLPASIRKQFKIADGDQIILEAGEDLKIVPLNSKLKQFQSYVKEMNKNNISLVDKLKETRMKEFDNE